MTRRAMGLLPELRCPAWEIGVVGNWGAEIGVAPFFRPIAVPQRRPRRTARAGLGGFGPLGSRSGRPGPPAGVARSRRFAGPLRHGTRAGGRGGRAYPFLPPVPRVRNDALMMVRRTVPARKPETRAQPAAPEAQRAPPQRGGANREWGSGGRSALPDGIINPSRPLNSA
jgi:hypothetical protein